MGENTTAPWDEMFAKLKEYKENHGTCHVPVTKPRPSYKELALWVTSQRRTYKELESHPTDQPRTNNMITEEQVNLLNGIGFSWSGENTMRPWHEMFEELKEYKEKHGTCHVPVTKPSPEHKELGVWVSYLRRKHKELKKQPADQPRTEDMITDEKVDLLDQLGFSWDAKTKPWEDMFRLLEEYKTNHGDCLVPVRKPKGPTKSLARWVSASFFWGICNGPLPHLCWSFHHT
jgi:hypothetical protein